MLWSRCWRRNVGLELESWGERLVMKTWARGEGGVVECLLCGERGYDCEGDVWGIGTPEGEEETEWGIGPPGWGGRRPGGVGPCGWCGAEKWGIGPPGGVEASEWGIGPLQGSGD